jgi:hypothetical protein
VEVVNLETFELKFRKIFKPPVVIVLESGESLHEKVLMGSF